MKNPYVHKAISTKLNNQIENMIKKIQEAFGIKINKVEASKIVAWKSECNINYNKLDEEKLIKILGDNS